MYAAKSGTQMHNNNTLLNGVHLVPKSSCCLSFLVVSYSEATNDPINFHINMRSWNLHLYRIHNSSLYVSFVSKVYFLQYWITNLSFVSGFVRWGLWYYFFRRSCKKLFDFLNLNLDFSRYISGKYFKMLTQYPMRIINHNSGIFQLLCPFFGRSCYSINFRRKNPQLNNLLSTT